ncbi:ribokinase [Corynebacterium sp. MSK044]|uniref:ribokinase n=1 Tax=Corynebacterium sp. MSK044 TaxID=3050195 RepID=UPI00254E4753|nr:ribokinase [Corynebacterium sp. MSK044]MDK8796506.1 ribokinase [Corynebacterium sp. MSK044]
MIVVVGSINTDLTVNVPRHPHPGETLLGSGGGITAGGKGANQAVAAARLGSPVAFVGAVGRDANAAAATALLTDAGVDLTAVETLDDVTGLAVITVAADGENTVMVISGANARVGRGIVDKHADLIARAEILLLQGEIPAEGCERAVEIAQAAGARVVVNLAPVIPVDPAVLFAADPLVLNEHEATLVAGQLGLEAPVTASDLVRAGVPSVVITYGADGATIADAHGSTHIPAALVTPVDTVGAGDAFTGALCHKLREGASLIDASQHASRVAAFAVTRPGAQPSYPWPEDELPEL